jgi:hypothetical protein
MANAAIARQRDHLAFAIARLRTDCLRNCIGHRSVSEGSEKTALAVHAQISRSPNRWCADIASEDRVVRGELIDQSRDKLRMNRRSPGLPVASSSSPLRTSW